MVSFGQQNEGGVANNFIPTVPLLPEQAVPPHAIGHEKRGGVYEARHGERSPGHGAESYQEVRDRGALARDNLHHEGRHVVHEKHP